MTRADVVIVGAGIAGLATALGLARRGVDALLLEREDVHATHSSARNAAIWLPVDDDQTTPELARQSAALLDDLMGRQAWLPRPIGALAIAKDKSALSETERGARRNGLVASWIVEDDLARLSPALAHGAARIGLHLADAGELDPAAIVEALRRAAKAKLRTATDVARVIVESDRVVGVELVNGERIGAETVVLAAGAWSEELASRSSLPLELVPLRRHLVLLDVPAGCAQTPIVWSVDPETYFRPESGGLLASPCDEVSFAPCLPPIDPERLDDLAQRLAYWTPLLVEARVRRAWACLRTFAPDREIVAGLDPRVRGLAWLAGLGGRGITVGVAAGDLVARAICGESDASIERVSPRRLISDR